MIETILVATDGSEDGNAAEQTAMGLASRLRVKKSDEHDSVSLSA